MAMILPTLLIYMCVDFVTLFPSKYCNSKSKSFLFMFDCQGGFKEQVNFVRTAIQYFKLHTREGDTFRKYTVLEEGLVGTFKLDSMADIKCTYIPLGDRIASYNGWKERQNFNIYDVCNAFYIAIIFIYDLASGENQTVYDQNDNHVYFIIQSSENISNDYIYSTSTFQDLNIEDIFPKICDNSLEYFSFSYFNTDHWNSTYFISKHLLDLNHKEAQCHCETYHGSDLISIETNDEGAYIFQILKNIFFSNFNATEINIHLGLRDFGNILMWLSNVPFYFFKPFDHSEQYSFYVNLSEEKKETFQLLIKDIHNLGRIMESIYCEKNVQRSLVVCEAKVGEGVFKFPYSQEYRSQETQTVIESSFFHDVLYRLFSEPKTLDDFLKPTSFSLNIINNRCSESIFKNNSHRELNGYICRQDVLDIGGSSFAAEQNGFIHILSKEFDHLYTLRNMEVPKFCKNYNECQQTIENDKDVTNNETNITIYCNNKMEDLNENVSCSAYSVILKNTLEHVECETRGGQNRYNCYNDGIPEHQCEDNSNLLYCEQFICPKPLVKCPNSFCINPKMLNDKHDHCPLGEDEHEKNISYISYQKLTFVLQEICIDSQLFDNIFNHVGELNFICNKFCPSKHICLSSKINSYIGNTTISQETVMHFFDIENDLFIKIDDVLYVNDEFSNILPFIILIAFYGNSCWPKLNDFDKAFQYWTFDELIILDLSDNDIIHSDYLQSISKLTKLKYLNVSYNKNLIIDTKFSFPYSLEIIDLSHTKLSVLKRDIFNGLMYLKHLNLSYTLISNFLDMGIPKYFKLNTLNIEGIFTNNIETDFFKGLTIDLELRASDYIICCPQILNANITVEKCHAPVDLISSCKHLVGDLIKRIVIWIVAIVTTLGNGFVLVYTLGWNRIILKKAYGYFITGLAISDLTMGVYLVVIAFADIHFSEVYVLKDYQWRNGISCQLVGFLSTFSMEASIFFICLITLDRYLIITYPFGEYEFSKTGKLLSFSMVWILSFILAILPAVFEDWEIYSSNGLCLPLPFSSTHFKGWIFSFAVFVGINSILFLLIAFGQVIIFVSLKKTKKSIEDISRQNPQRRSDELTVAKKLAMVALTDFCCWFPVGILGMLSIRGHVFDREVYAWIAVFVLPINSALNPIIYTLPALYSKFK